MKNQKEDLLCLIISEVEKDDSKRSIYIKISKIKKAEEYRRKEIKRQEMKNQPRPSTSGVWLRAGRPVAPRGIIYESDSDSNEPPTQHASDLPSPVPDLTSHQLLPQYNEERGSQIN